jgi:dephospho-CoA kinase
MMVIGITGGIASGKSTVARMMARRGVLHIDADAVVHALMQHDKATIAAVAAAFPKAIHNGKIDRKALGALIGKDAVALQTLEDILHPRVREAEIAAIRRATRQRRKAVILDIPLLFESGAEALCDVVVTATAPQALRKRRAFARPHMSEEKFARFIARQLDETARNAHADLAIPTTLGKAFTRRRVELLWKALKLA